MKRRAEKRAALDDAALDDAPAAFTTCPDCKFEQMRGRTDIHADVCPRYGKTHEHPPSETDDLELRIREIENVKSREGRSLPTL